MTTQSLSYSAHFRYLDSALKSRWGAFCKLENEINNFKPKPHSEFSDYRSSEIERLQKSNPDKTKEEIEKFVDEQLDFLSSAQFQFFDRFHEPFMKEYVIVIMLSHSLCESFINAILAVGLSHVDSEDLFPLLERSNFKQKWISAPKSINSSYNFPNGSSLHETLNYLTKQRNALIHYKIELKVDGEKILNGSNFQPFDIKEETPWVRRFFSLPYDLLEFANSEFPDISLMLVIDRKPIHKSSVHDNAYR